MFLSLAFFLFSYYLSDTTIVKNESLTFHNIVQDTIPKSLFEFIYTLSERPSVTVKTDYDQLVKKKSYEEYQDAFFQLTNTTTGQPVVLECRIRTRGNVRKEVCRIPPFKIDFSKNQLKLLGLDTLDKLKFVFPCNGSKQSQINLLKEHFLYSLYALIDTNGIRSKLVDAIFVHEGEEELNLTGFIIEDEESYAKRKNARIIEAGVIRTGSMERIPFLKMLIFQYMIANTDWAVSNKHNIEFVKLPENKRINALPYDFDYAGFVGQPYAIPNENLGLKDVHERYFFKYKIEKNEFDYLVNYFLSIESQVYTLCEEANYLDNSTIKTNKKYLKSFFDLLRNPNYFKSLIMN